jgi:DNA primase
LSQALAHVLQYPSAARGVRDPESLRLGGERGLEVLADIIEMLHESPDLSTGQLVERWRDRPEHARLLALASQPLPDLPPEAAQREFIAAVERLTREAGPDRRIDELIMKAGADGLSDDEKQELRELQARPRSTGPGPR